MTKKNDFVNFCQKKINKVFFFLNTFFFVKEIENYEVR